MMESARSLPPAIQPAEAVSASQTTPGILTGMTELKVPLGSGHQASGCRGCGGADGVHVADRFRPAPAARSLHAARQHRPGAACERPVVTARPGPRACPAGDLRVRRVTSAVSVPCDRSRAVGPALRRSRTGPSGHVCPSECSGRDPCLSPRSASAYGAGSDGVRTGCSSRVVACSRVLTSPADGVMDTVQYFNSILAV